MASDDNYFIHLINLVVYYIFVIESVIIFQNILIIQNSFVNTTKVQWNRKWYIRKNQDFYVEFSSKFKMRRLPEISAVRPVTKFPLSYLLSSASSPGPWQLSTVHSLLVFSINQTCHSTEAAALTPVEITHSVSWTKKLTALVILDLRLAFETVLHASYFIAFNTRSIFQVLPQLVCIQTHELHSVSSLQAIHFNANAPAVLDCYCSLPGCTQFIWHSVLLACSSPCYHLYIN